VFVLVSVLVSVLVFVSGMRQADLV